MSHRRSTSWIHRWSRFLITAISTLGAVITGYLTFVKLAGGAAACPVSGCNQVLSSPYATIFGLPLALFGFLTYTSMVVLAVAPWLIQPKTNKELRSLLEDWSWHLMFVGATAMMIFSSYLMYLMAFEIKSLCFYCIASAIFSLGLFVLTLIGRTQPDIGQLFFTAIMVGIITLIGTLGVYANVNQPLATTQSSSNEVSNPITTTSGAAENTLTQHLHQVGAKMYGAFWCPHCHEQKLLFGQAAWSQINYIECDPEGENPQPNLCEAANIKGYPTWEINDQFYQGTQPLEKLADLSGYQGLRNFQADNS